MSDDLRPRQAARRARRLTGSGHPTGVRRRAARETPAELLPRSQWFGPLLSLLLLAVCLAFLLAAASGVFRVRRVEVVGAGVPATTVVQAADVLGKNIFRLRSDQVVARLSQVPSIVVRRVDLSLPDRVIIYASVRVPLVAWQSGPSLYELDADGRVIRQVRSTSLPTIVGAAASGPQPPGDLVSLVQAVHYAAGSLPGVPNGAVSSFRFQPQTGLSIVGRAGWTADLGTGSPQTLVNRVATLAGLLANKRARTRRLQYVDLRSQAPYARFTGA